MTQEEIADILYDGTEEQINNVRCECGNKLKYWYGGETFTVTCDKCNYIDKYIKSPVPNCIKLFDS